MNALRTEKARIFLVNWLFTSLYGISLGEWLRLLRRHRFEVDPPYLPRAAFMTFTSFLTSLFRVYEDWKYFPELANIEVQRPLFILGHWRSGTTLLQNLLCADKQFAYPNVWQG